jgi:hypothetical protein
LNSLLQLLDRPLLCQAIHLTRLWRQHATGRNATNTFCSKALGGCKGSLASEKLAAPHVRTRRSTKRREFPAGRLEAVCTCTSTWSTTSLLPLGQLPAHLVAAGAASRSSGELAGPACGASPAGCFPAVAEATAEKHLRGKQLDKHLAITHSRSCARGRARHL